jgi:hypothetical protein
MSMEMLWYLLLVGVAVALFGSILASMALRHRRYMRALEILKTYAEKGVEPPAEVTALLLQPLADTAERKAVARTTSEATAQATVKATAQATASMTWLFPACVAGAVAWWLLHGGGAKEIAAYVAVAFAIFFGASALAALLSALTSGLALRSSFHGLPNSRDRLNEDK